jgi:hypothetical protein
MQAWLERFVEVRAETHVPNMPEQEVVFRTRIGYSRGNFRRG